MTNSLELEITGIAHGGFGVGRTDDGLAAFVRGAIPGERVRAEVWEQKTRFVKATAVAVLEASEYRVTHPWPLGAAGETGAADFGHIALDFQRELKRRVILEQAQRIGGGRLAEQLEGFDMRPKALERPLVSMSASDSGYGWHTRTRVDVVKLRRGVGMYREHSHELLPLTHMPLAVSELDSLGLWGGSSASSRHWDELIKPGTRLRVVAPASGANVVAAANHAWTSARHELSGRISERASDGERIYDYELSPTGFWQIHYGAPSALLTRVMRGTQAQSGMRVLELFSGAGLFSLPLARAIGEHGQLLSIEGSDVAVQDARRNLRELPWAQARQGWIDERSVRDGLDELDPDVVVVDPPRAGLGIKGARELAASNARRVVLVSCDPAAMARDAGALVEGGWQLASAEALDLFPHTHHIETILTLVRR